MAIHIDTITEKYFKGTRYWANDHLIAVVFEGPCGELEVMDSSNGRQWATPTEVAIIRRNVLRAAITWVRNYGDMTKTQEQDARALLNQVAHRFGV